jgi:hypothetical protein
MREVEGKKKGGKRRGRKAEGIMKEETGKRSVIFCDSAIQNAMAT